MSEAWNIRFGTAGTSDSFAAQGYKSSLDVPEYTAKMGLNAFEYQCGRGCVWGWIRPPAWLPLPPSGIILFSVHAPYYISMSSLEEDKRLNSIQYLLQSAAVCRALGGRRIIFHSGSCGKQSGKLRWRRHWIPCAALWLRWTRRALGYDPVPGDHGQDRTAGHTGRGADAVRRGQPHYPLHRLRPPDARTLGGIQTKADYAAILDRMAEVLGDDRARQFHVHFSRIEYSAGGEKRHWTFADTQFGPEPQP